MEAQFEGSAPEQRNQTIACDVHQDRHGHGDKQRIHRCQLQLWALCTLRCALKVPGDQRRDPREQHDEACQKGEREVHPGRNSALARLYRDRESAGAGISRHNCIRAALAFAGKADQFRIAADPLRCGGCAALVLPGGDRCHDP